MKLLKYCLLLWGLTGVALSPVWAANALKDHPSPYLAMHGDDPVDWHEWGEPALAMARAQNKPLFVSVGYFACHWCHVMQRESYRNSEIAAWLNTHFISVKVDRELRPTLDAALIEFVQRTQGHAGWPLNVFLTPQGAPLAGIVYQPAKNFLATLKVVSQRWAEDPEALRAMANSAVDELNGLRDEALHFDAAAQSGLVMAFRTQAMQAADLVAGGFGGQNKFPSVPQLNALLTLSQTGSPATAPDKQDESGAGSDEAVSTFVGYTLFMMASQGLRDHLGGGFFRYTTDPGWQTPHFEKMLYDNAQLADLYLRAADVLKRPTFRAVAFETLDFVIRELGADEGAYAASLSAVDEDGVEGGGYLWDSYELGQLLDKPQLAVLRIAWKLDEPAHFEAGHLPVQSAELAEIAAQLKLDRAKVIETWNQARATLLAARKQRVVPRDGKRVTAWNGLMLTALAHAGSSAGGQRFREPANRLADYLLHQAWRSDQRGGSQDKRDAAAREGELLRAVDGRGAKARAIGKAGLEDYALLARGLADYAQQSWSGERGKLAGQRALVLVEQGLRRFYVGQRWRLSEDALVPMDLSEAMVVDGAIMSSSAALLEAGLLLTSKADSASDSASTALRERLLAIRATASNAVEEAAFGYASHIRLLMRAAAE